MIIIKRISFQEKVAIVEYYKSRPMTNAECAEHFGLSNPTIIKILDMFRVPRWSKSMLYSPNLDETYFDEIDTPQKAYWLGLLMTDGCVFEKRGKTPRLCLTLKTEDEYLIEQFLLDLRCRKNIVRTNGRRESSVQICSKKLCDALKNYGVIPRKTGAQSFICPNYPEAYLHGLIDGDGSISFYSRPNRSCHYKSIRLCGANREFLEGVISFVGCGRIEKSHRDMETITWSSNDDMMRIIKAITAYPTACLKRKMVVMDKIAEEIGKYRDNRRDL